jgi:hypothetical protein
MESRPGSARACPAGGDAATRPESPGAVERLRDRNEALEAENARLRRESEALARHFASFPLLNPHPVLEVDFVGGIRFCNPATVTVLESLGLSMETARPFLPHDLGAVVAGSGFDPAYAAQLFQPFHRLHAEREYPGTGIGLALVGRIVSLHGGRAWAEGRPGAGATFFFTLGDGK